MVHHTHSEDKEMIRTASLFSQLLHQVPRNEFAKLVAKHDAERNAKGFTCWTQFTAMLFCQLSLDSTTVPLCLSLFSWATFRRAKGGVKAHVLLDHDDYMPSFVLITEARCHDAKILHLLCLAAGSIIVMDRAYNHYQQSPHGSLRGSSSSHA